LLLDNRLHLLDQVLNPGKLRPDLSDGLGTRLPCLTVLGRSLFAE
jgi:hypothetical protein